MSTLEKVNHQPSKERFEFHIGKLLDIPRKNGATIAIVGGMALRAALRKPVEFMRGNGSIPDMDAIGLGTDRETLIKTDREMRDYRRAHPDCPDIGLESIIFSDKPSSYSPTELLSGIRKNSRGDMFLTFREIEIPINPGTLEVVDKPYGNVVIPTLPAETIFWRYLVRNGVLKPKDAAKLKELEDFIKVAGGDGIDRSLYLPYEEFYRQVNEKYRIPLSLVRLYWYMDQKTGGRISAAANPAKLLRKNG